MNHYEYTALSDLSNSIRLIELYPGAFEDEVTISLKEVTVGGSEWSSFEALSYVWGSSLDKANVKVKDTNHGLLAVTASLATALPYLRYRDKSRFLWIDAISINQQDLEERSSQVLSMADIYSSAKRVIVWLGVPGNESGKALDTLQRIGNEITIDWAANVITNNETGEVVQHDLWANGTPLISDDEWVAISHLMGRPWFERLWVRQEISLASPEAIVMCGHDTVPWIALRNATYRTHFNGAPVHVPHLTERVAAVFDMCDYEDNRSLSDVLHRTKGCKCTDPRDRVFAILNLVKRGVRQLKVLPDYRKTVTDVYRDLVLQHAFEMGNLDLLTHAELRQGSPNRATWVPDLNQPTNHNGLWMPYAGGKALARVSYDGTTLLTAAGVIAAKINKCEVGPQKGFRNIQILGWFRRQLLTRSSGEYPSGGSTLYEFTKALAVNLFSHRTIPPSPGYADINEIIQVIDEIETELTDEVLLTRLRRYLDSVNYWSRNRSLITTQEGYVGWGPLTSQPGDQVCVLLGCKTPLVLRPVAGGNQWRVVGESFVHGLMDAEALLGPLPTDVVSAYYLIPGTQDYGRKYLNEKTGVVMDQDPRPVSYSPDLEKVFSTDALQQRGIELQDLALI